MFLLLFFVFFFFFNHTATTEIYTLSLHDALPICRTGESGFHDARHGRMGLVDLETGDGETGPGVPPGAPCEVSHATRSEEHTSELQSRQYLVCRLLLEKKNKN